MKLLLLLFVAFTTPFALFLGTLLYGGISEDNLKKALAGSGVYNQLSLYFAAMDAEAIEQNASVSDFVSKRLTPEYIRLKTETAIDDSAKWITGNSQTAPLISFNEIKQDMLVEAPELLNNLEHTPTEAEIEQLGLNQEQREDYLAETRQINAFTDQDFTISLEQYLLGIKEVYQGLKIATPILVIILFLSLIVIVLHTESLPAKFKWLGATFLTTGVVGFVAIYFNKFIEAAVTQINIYEQSDYLAIISPIFLAVLNHFINVYTEYQGIASGILLLAAAGCFAGAILTRKYAAPTTKPLKVDPDFWRKSTPKKN